MRVTAAALFVLSGISLCSVPSFAGKLPVCVAATLSANRNALVINDLTVEGPEGFPQKVIGSVFRIFKQLEEPTAGLRITGPDTYWRSGPLWSVQFPNQETSSIIACPYVLVTDDAEFLVLVMDQPSSTALRIYRRREHLGQPRIERGPDNGVLIRAIPLDEIIPPPSSVLERGFTDHTPQWYSKGDFTFLADNRTLLYRDKVAGTVRIDLATGGLSKEHP